MDFNIEGKHIIVNERYRDYDISVATNHHGRNVDIMVFDMRKSEGEQDVTKEFKCFGGGDINGTFENLRTIMDEIDEREDGIKTKMLALNSIPPNSNPFHYDMTRMGVNAGNFVIMHMGKESRFKNEVVVVHTPTGRRVSLNFS